MTSRPGGWYSPACQSGEWTSAWIAVAIEEDELLAVLGGLVDPGPELLDLVRLVGDAQPAGLLEVAVDAVRPGERDRRREVGDPLRARGASISSGKWRIPLARPWVSDAWQNPPFRPLAPNPTVSCSRTTTRSDGSVSVRAIAVHSPVNPAPTIATSAVGDAARAAAATGPGRRRREPVADRGRRIGHRWSSTRG